MKSCSLLAAEAQRDQLERPQLEVDRWTVAGGTLWQRPLQQIRRFHRPNLRGGGDRGPRPAAQRLVKPDHQVAAAVLGQLDGLDHDGRVADRDQRRRPAATPRTRRGGRLVR